MQRQDHIQGLRAIAVLVVLVFHAFPEALPGGFIGVDLFFVISGFLIARSSLMQIELGTFSPFRFISRRLMRLLPALLMVFWFLLVFGWFFALPSEYASLGQYVRSGALFTSNWLSWSEAGYFDAEATTKPLLHLWSLGVEMSFYVGFAVVFGFVAQFKKSDFVQILSWVATILLIGSLLLSIWCTDQAPKTAYYSPLARAWEFLAGVLLAIAVRTRGELKSVGGAVGSELVLFSLVIGLSLFLAANEDLGFPGWVALFPVSAGVLVLLQGKETTLSRALSSRMLVWLGNVSYPLYLWHWPLITLGWIYLSEQPPGWFLGVALVTSLVMAWLTARFVERPCAKLYSRKKWLVYVFIFLAVVTAASGQNIYARHGLEFRDTPALKTNVVGELDAPAYFSHLQQNFVACEDLALQAATGLFEGRSRCYQSAPGRLSILLLGDSHAEHLLPGMSKLMPYEVVGLALGSGAPVMQNERFKAYFDLAVASSSIHTVFISALWLDRMQQMPGPLRDFHHAFRESVERLTESGKRVVLLGDVPAFSFHPKRCKYARPGQGGQCVEDLGGKLERIQGSEGPLRNIAATYPMVDYWSPIDCFCQGSACKMEAGGRLFFRDKNHLTVEGSEHLAACFAKAGMQVRGLRAP